MAGRVERRKRNVQQDFPKRRSSDEGLFRPEIAKFFVSMTENSFQLPVIQPTVSPFGQALVQLQRAEPHPFQIFSKASFFR